MNKLSSKLPFRFKGFNVQAMNFSMRHRLFFTFLFGIVLGTFLVNISSDYLDGTIGIYSEYAIDNCFSYNISKFSFFVHCVKKYIVELLLIFLMHFTSLWRKFDYLYCVYKGAVMGILISSATITYGAGGIVLYVASIFPHYIIYVVMIVFSLYFNIKVKANVNKKKLYIPYIRGIIIETILIAVTAFVEAYVNYPIILNVFKG